jgi:3-oxoacyl-[acyl-carrier protein] reductase
MAGVANRTALVTGAGRGIGRAVALGLAAAGARIAILARSTHELAWVASVARGLGARVLVLGADVGDPSQVADAASRALDEFGTVDVLVNNAAVVWPLGPTVSVDPTDWSAALAINVLGPVTLTSLLLPAMLEQQWGRIVNVSGGIAARPAAMIGGNAYAASKAALEAHTVNLAAELKGTGVTVNAYRPGTVDTSMQAWIRSQRPEQIGPALRERFVLTYQQGSLISPGQAARSLLAHLASDSSSGGIWTAADA